MNWNLISEALPEVGQTVLLHWPTPGMPPIYRLGSILSKAFGVEVPIWKFNLDYGDAGAWVFTNREDEQPTHWAALEGPES